MNDHQAIITAAVSAAVPTLTVLVALYFNRRDASAVRTELKSDIANVKTELKAEILLARTEAHSDMLSIQSVLRDHAERIARLEPH